MAKPGGRIGHPRRISDHTDSVLLTGAPDQSTQRLKQSFLYCVGHRIVSAEEPSMKADRSRSERSLCSAFSAACRSFCCGFGMFGVFLTLVMDAAVLLLLREASGRKQIEHGLKEIAAGDLDYKIDLTELQGKTTFSLPELSIRSERK